MKTTLRSFLIVCVAVLAFVACTTTEVKENPPGSGILQTNDIVHPKLTAGLEAAKAVNDASAPFNPWHGLGAIIIGGIASSASWWAKYKNTRRQLEAVIEGVETATDKSQVQSFKAIIQETAKEAGIEKSLNKTVRALTP